MKEVEIGVHHVGLAMDVTLWYGHRGQGGTVTELGDDTITLESGTSRQVNVMPRAGITHITRGVPFDADECLNYGDDGRDCAGPVDMWWSGGGHSWPRCTYHGEERLRQYETSMERYADSACAPSWFDPGYAGERWDDE